MKELRLVATVVLLTLALTLPTTADNSANSEVQKLSSAPRNAQSQSEMNHASGRIADYWNTQLAAVQSKIEKKLDRKARTKFRRSATSWEAYRTAEVDFHASLYEGGSIQPLIANTAFADITRQRVEDLQSLFAQEFDGRHDAKSLDVSSH